MNEEEIHDIFVQSGALLEGHFLLSSGLHSSRYCEKFAVLQQPRLTEALCKELARRYANEKIDVVVGPLTGGMLMAHEVAKSFGTRALFTEREGDKMVFRRGFTIEPGERVLVVDDVVTTGGSVNEVLAAVQQEGGQVIGIGLLVDRSGGTVDFGVPTQALLNLDASRESFSPQDCPLCKAQVPFTTRGSRFTKKGGQDK